MQDLHTYYSTLPHITFLIYYSPVVMRFLPYFGITFSTTTINLVCLPIFFSLYHILLWVGCIFILCAIASCANFICLRISDANIWKMLSRGIMCCDILWGCWTLPCIISFILLDPRNAYFVDFMIRFKGRNNVWNHF